MLRRYITAAAAAVAVAAGLAACGSVQFGQAATTTRQSISAATLTSQVSDLDQAYQASKGRVQLQFPQSQMPQQVLAWLVRFQVRERLATREGIAVTRAQTQQELASLRTQAKQSGTTLTDLAVANGLPPDLLNELGRFQAIEVAAFRKLGGGTLPSSSSALQKLSKKFDSQQCLAAKSLAIKINPQYGQLNYAQLTVVPAASTLSAPEGKPSPQPTAGLTPPC